MTQIPHHRTKIVCTLGPATDRPGVVEKMLLAGMDVARINAVHGPPEEHRRRIRHARQTAGRRGAPLAILLDLPGPKHRLGRLRSSSVTLQRGKEISLGGEADDEALPLADSGLLLDLKPGDPVYMADGTVRLTVLRRSKSMARCRVDVGGTVRSGSGLNMPGSKLSVRIPTAQDRPWIRFACKEGIEWIGISFVRTPDDVKNVRKHLTPAGGGPRLIAKIEKREALENLGDIAQEADGLMVARGDLGVETPLESVPLAQKRIILAALKEGKPVITATQMLESMVDQFSPTRAEAADVANAVLDGTDAVMLSAETAIGAYPVEAVGILDRVIRETEKSYPYEAVRARFSQDAWEDLDDAMSLVACRLSHDQRAQAIVICPRARVSPRQLARFRPQATIFALTDHPRGAHSPNLLWSVRPVVVPAPHRGNRAFLEVLRRRGLIRPTAPVIFIAPSEDRAPAVSDHVQVIRA